MLNTILFRSTYKKKLTGDVNFLALKMMEVEEKEADLQSAFIWLSYGGHSFWEKIWEQNIIIPEKWRD